MNILKMSIKQGELYWINFSPSTGSELKGRHPALIIQSTHINQTAIGTTVAVGISSNLKLKDVPGNVFIKKGEGALPKDSVANVSKLFTISKSRLGKKIGLLPSQYLGKIFEGIDMLFGR